MVTYNGATLYTRDDIAAKMTSSYKDVITSMYGKVDKVKTDTVLKIPLMLCGAYENLSVMFPSVFLGGAVGQSLFGNSDVPLVVLGRNGDQITYANAQITKMADLRLGVDNDLFSAAVEFTAILANGKNPEAAGAYVTLTTGQTYADNAFSKANFQRARFTGAWGASTGFTSIVPQDGFQIGWQCETKPVAVDGLGTVDMTVDGFVAQCKCIPIGPTMAQLDANSMLHQPHGTLLSNNVANLTLAGTGVGEHDDRAE